MRLKRAFFLFFLTLFTLLAGTWFILQATGAGQSIIRNILSRNLRSNYTISGADLDILDGTAEIDELNLQDPVKPEKELISIRKVIIGLSQNPLELGKLNVITLTGVELHLRLGREEVPDLSRLITSTGGQQGNELPEIRLEDSTCHLYLPGAEKPAWTCDRIALHLRPRAVEGRTRTYGIEGGFSAPQGLSLQLSGDLILREGERPRIRLEASCPGWRMQRGFVTGIPWIDRELAEIKPTGRVSFKAWLDYPGKEGRLYGRLRLEAKELAFTAPQFPYPVKGLAGSLEVLTGGQNALTIDLASTATTASFTIKGRILDFLSPYPGGSSPAGPMG